MGFIKELFIGRKIYLTTDLPKDRIYYGNVNEWGGITDAGNNWQELLL